MTTFQYVIGRHLWVKQSRPWNAVLGTVALPMFRDEDRDELMEHIDLDRKVIDWGAIHQLAQTFSHEQRTLLRIAHALFNGGDCQLSELDTLSNAGRSAAILLIGQRYR